MLPRKRKISKESFVKEKRIFRSKTGQTTKVTAGQVKKIETKNFKVLVLKCLGESKFSIIISKKLIKGAVERNRTRRKFYNTIKDLNIKSGFLFFFYLKSSLLNFKLKELEYQIIDFFKEQQFLTNKNKK